MVVHYVESKLQSLPLERIHNINMIFGITGIFGSVRRICNSVMEGR